MDSSLCSSVNDYGSTYSDSQKSEMSLSESTSDCNHDLDSNIDHARREFNKNRKIIIKNIPPVTYEV